MSKYKGLFTFDVDNHRYLPIEQADGLISDMNYYPKADEEPKKYWYIGYKNIVRVAEKKFRSEYADNDIAKKRKEIGNYFETKEEAEKAVEKLKAWKRLKDKGAEFYGWRRNQTGTYELYMRWEDRISRSYEVKKDLDLLFGSEE